MIRPFRLLWLRLCAFDARCRYENAYKLHQDCLDDLSRVRPILNRAEAALQTANLRVLAAELGNARIAR